MRKFVFVLALASLFILSIAGSAFAAGSHYVHGAAEPNGDRTMAATAENCNDCHGGAALHTAGPHGGYTSATDKCQSCHDVHGTAENAVLLMGQNLTAACQYCHDLTATWAGPYNMAGIDKVGSAHKVVGIDVYSYTDTQGQPNEPLAAGILEIPGGNWYDGSEGILMTVGQGQLSGQVFTCNSCHTPHDVRTVDPYLGESPVKHYEDVDGNEIIYMTTRILKQRPNANQFTAGSVVGVDIYKQYDSRWCAACHMGRDNRIVEMTNHPVNTNKAGDIGIELLASNADGKPYIPGYQFLTPTPGGTSTSPIAGGKTLTQIILDNKIEIGPEVTRDPRSNAQYRLTSHDYNDPDNPGSSTSPGQLRDDADGYAYDDVSEVDTGFGQNGGIYDDGPACQQCHGSARDVEAIYQPNVNPERGTFPHVSRNKAFLVEEGDDFCSNCHNPYNLP